MGYLSACNVAFSNFSIQYNFGSIAIALLFMSRDVCTLSDAECRMGLQAPWVQGTASSIVFFGAVIGQLIMGYLGDVIGRNNATLFTLSICFVASFLQAIPRGSPSTIYSLIIAFRFFLGVGAGGIYPLSATKAVEDSSAEEGEGHPQNGECAVSAGNAVGKGKGAVSAGKGFFWQIPGSMAPYCVAIALTKSTLGPDVRWRLLLGLGAVPSFLAIVLTLVEMHLYRQLAPTGENKLPQSDADSTGDIIPAPLPSPALPGGPGTSTFWQLFRLLRSADIQRKFLATGVCWFLADITSYGIYLLSPQIIAKIEHDEKNITSNHSIYQLSSLNLLVMSLSLPGIILTIYLLPIWGIKKLQWVGFALTAAFCLLLGICFEPLQNNSKSLLALYCLLSVAMSLGVAVSTYALPALLFEKNVRTSMNGLCAATGKVGAVVGSFSFGTIARTTHHGFTTVMILCFVCSSVATLLSLRFIPDLAAETKTETETETETETNREQEDVASNFEIELHPSGEGNNPILHSPGSRA